MMWWGIMNDILNLDENRRKILIRLSLYLLSSLILCLWLFPPNEEIELTREEINENLTVVRVSDLEFSKPTIRNNIGDILQVPFNLRWYDICFEFIWSRITYENITEEANGTAFLDFNNNEDNITLSPGETRCIPYRVNKDFTYQWSFEIPLTISYEDVVTGREKTMSYNTRTYAKPEINSLMVKYTLVIISWSGLLWLFTRIIKLIFRTERL